MSTNLNDEFELTYFKATIQYFSQYATGIHLFYSVEQKDKDSI